MPSAFTCGQVVLGVVLGLVLCGANWLEANSVVSDVLSDINDKYRILHSFNLGEKFKTCNNRLVAVIL